MKPEPIFNDGTVALYHGDAREIAPQLQLDPGLVIYDPPWDDAELGAWAPPSAPSMLVFTDPRRIGDAVTAFGPPAGLFTWDTMNQWTTGPRRPVQQTKHALWYGDLDSYRRDAELWGDRPPDRDHPSTKQTPLDGRRLTDLWRESLRWLHNPSAGQTRARSSAHRHRRGDEALRHAKPVGWLRCLISNCSEGLVFDPFVGSGTTLRAAQELGRPAVGIEIDADACAVTIDRLAQGVLIA